MTTQVGSWSSSKWRLASARNLSRDPSGSWHSVLEEQDRLGSQAFASRLKAERRELAGAIILECVGFARSEAGTQQIPPGVPIAVPTQGDFLAIVGNEASRSLVLQLEQDATAAGGSAQAPVFGGAGPRGGYASYPSQRPCLVLGCRLSSCGVDRIRRTSGILITIVRLIPWPH